MIVHDCIPGSPEWHALRLGRLTASHASDLLTPARLGLSKSRWPLMWRLLHEWVTGSSAEEFGGNRWTEHGLALEGEAADWFTLQTGLDAVPVGFISDGDAGCSPDLWVPGQAGLELKCPAGWTHLRYLSELDVPSEYALQVQFSLWLTQLPVWYFMSYASSPHDDSLLPSWRPGAYMPPLLIEVEPDEQCQDALSEHVPEFLAEMQRQRETLKDAGVIETTAMEDAA